MQNPLTLRRAVHSHTVQPDCTADCTDVAHSISASDTLQCAAAAALRISVLQLPSNHMQCGDASQKPFKRLPCVRIPGPAPQKHPHTLTPAILSSPLNLFCRVVPAAPDSGDSQPHLGTAPAAFRAFMASKMSELYSSFCRGCMRWWVRVEVGTQTA